MAAANPLGEPIIVGALNPVENKAVDAPSHTVVNEKLDHIAVDDASADANIHDNNKEKDNDANSDDAIIITGADAARYLLPMRDDGDPALTFRSLLLSSGLAAFQAVMYQIYSVSHEKT